MLSAKEPPKVSCHPPQHMSSRTNCRRCSRGSHSRQFCPAREATCFCCSRKNHCVAQCQSNTIVELTAQVNQTEVPYEETAHLDPIEVTNKNMWEVKIDIEDKCVCFKIDTGWRSHSIVKFNMKSLKLSTPLRKARTSLCGPDQSSLMVIRDSYRQISHIYSDSFGKPCAYLLYSSATFSNKPCL